MMVQANSPTPSPSRRRFRWTTASTDWRKTLHAFEKHVAKVKDKVDGSAGSKSPLKKKKQQWRLHLLAARAQEDEGR